MADYDGIDWAEIRAQNKQSEKEATAMETFHVAYRDPAGRHMYCLGTSGLSREQANAVLRDRLVNGKAQPQEYVASDSDLSAEDRRIAGL